MVDTRAGASLADAFLSSGGLDSHGIGRRAFIAGAAGAVAGATLLSGAAHAVEPGASYFVPVDPERFCDTRKRFGYSTLGGTTIRVPIGGVKSVPREAVAVALTLTGVNLAGGNWLSAYPAGQAWPGTASSNSEFPGQAVANLVTVKLGKGGAIDVRSMAPSHVVVDVAGYYLPATGPVAAGRLETVEPFRIMDTRKTGKPRAGQTVAVDLKGRLPADAVAVVANVTAVETEGGGFVTALQIRAVASAGLVSQLWAGRSPSVRSDGQTGLVVGTVRLSALHDGAIASGRRRHRLHDRSDFEQTID